MDVSHPLPGGAVRPIACGISRPVVVKAQDVEARLSQAGSQHSIGPMRPDVFVSCRIAQHDAKIANRSSCRGVVNP